MSSQTTTRSARTVAPVVDPGNAPTPKPEGTVKFSLASLMDTHGLTIESLAHRIGSTEYRVRKLRAREFWSLADVKRMYRAVTGQRPATPDASAKYVNLDIVDANGEVKSYRAYPHHGRGLRKWALWQGSGKPTHWVSAPDRGEQSLPIASECACTCPDHQRHEGKKTTCKHVQSLMDNWMI